MRRFLLACLAVLLLAGAVDGLVVVWAVFVVVFMGGRCVTLVRRERGDAWLVTGSTVSR